MVSGGRTKLLGVGDILPRLKAWASSDYTCASALSHIVPASTTELAPIGSGGSMSTGVEIRRSPHLSSMFRAAFKSRKQDRLEEEIKKEIRG